VQPPIGGWFRLLLPVVGCAAAGMLNGGDIPLIEFLF